MGPSISPVAARPLRDWNAVTADLVAGPKMPSAPPGTFTPAASRAVCTTLTSLPVAPSRTPTIDGIRGAVTTTGEADTVAGTAPSTSAPTLTTQRPRPSTRTGDGRRLDRFVDVDGMDDLSPNTMK